MSRSIRSIAPADPVEAAVAAFDSAQAATSKARSALAEAERAKDLALEDAGDDVVAAAIARTMKCARAVSKAEGDEATARASLDAVARTRNLASLEQEIAFVEAQPARVRPIVERLRARRVQVWQDRQELASATIESQDAYDRAVALAEHLKMPVEVARRITRPTMRDVIAQLQAENARDDEQREHEDASDLLVAKGLPR